MQTKNSLGGFVTSVVFSGIDGSEEGLVQTVKFQIFFHIYQYINISQNIYANINNLYNKYLNKLFISSASMKFNLFNKI